MKAKSWHEPGGPADEESGTATRTMALDGRVLVEDFKGTMMGNPFSGHGMTGYDNVSGKYWSTWTDSMSTGLMISQGTCDAKMACTFNWLVERPGQERAGQVKDDVSLDQPDDRGVRDVRARQERQRDEDDGAYLHQELIRST